MSRRRSSRWSGRGACAGALLPPLPEETRMPGFQDPDLTKHSSAVATMAWQRRDTLIEKRAVHQGLRL